MQYRHPYPAETPENAPLGVLLVNLGTPDSPTVPDVRRYLAEFLSDPRVVEAPRLLWKLILHGIILRIRPARSAAAYREVWSDTGSPLLTISRAQQQALQAALDEQADRVKVVLAMRYGNPSVAAGLTELARAGVTRILVVALYPQYSASTSGSVFDAVSAELQQWRRVPELRFLQEYADEPGYIQALKASVEQHWAEHGRAERLLMSFHGIPERYRDNGDPYAAQCRQTAEALTAALGLQEGEWLMSFQSRVGREEWLKPYTDFTLKDWGAEKLASVDVICPGFSADCLETLEEIEEENREYFQQAGGGEYRYIHALNDRPEHIQLLSELVLRNLQGW